MQDITRLLSDLGRGRKEACDELIPLLYGELRALAAAKLMREKPGQTLQPTALVHEAYVRMLGGDAARSFQNRREFFAAAAETMRRILVDNARRKNAAKRDGKQVEITDALASVEGPSDDVISIHEALDDFAREEPAIAELVKLHYFAAMTIEEAAEVLGIAERTAYRDWKYAKVWLFDRLARS